MSYWKKVNFDERSWSIEVRGQGGRIKGSRDISGKWNSKNNNETKKVRNKHGFQRFFKFNFIINFVLVLNIINVWCVNVQLHENKIKTLKEKEREIQGWTYISITCDIHYRHQVGKKRKRKNKLRKWENRWHGKHRNTRKCIGRK